MDARIFSKYYAFWKNWLAKKIAPPNLDPVRSQNKGTQLVRNGTNRS
jgi:hypothetical protein